MGFSTDGMRLVKTPKTIQEILNDLTQHYPWETAHATGLLGQVWADIAGSTIARNARLIKVQQGTVHLAVTTGIWSQELQFMKPDLIRRLNERLAPAMTIIDIRTRVSIKAFSTAPQVRHINGERGFRMRREKNSEDQDLGRALEVARDRYREAVKEWLESGYHRCQICQSPTLIDYPICGVCEGASGRRIHPQRER